MTKTDLFKNTATEHHGKHHETNVTDMTSKDGTTSTTQSTPEDKTRSHRKAKKERKTTMKSRIATTLTGLAIALMLTSTTISSTQNGTFTGTDDSFTTGTTNICSSCSDTLSSRMVGSYTPDSYTSTNTGV